MFSPEQYDALRHGAGLVNRSNRGRLRLSGEDRRSYLQGLLTNDIQALVAGSGCYSCLLTAQGRMIADMYVVETGEAILMDLEGFIAPAVAEHLERFVFSEDVEVADLTSTTAQLGVFGPLAGDLLARALGQAGDRPIVPRSELEGMPILGNRIVTWNDVVLTVIRRDDIGGIGFDLLVGADHAESLAVALRAAGAIDVDAGAFDVCRIEAGRPVFGKDMTDDTIPLEAGIQDRAISLTKGCYVGQEIIIRVLHRGHGRVARRLVGLTLDNDAAPPSRGAVVRSGERDIGAVTSAASSPGLRRAIAMGYVHRDFTEPGTRVTIAGGDGDSAATVSALPFPIDS